MRPSSLLLATTSALLAAGSLSACNPLGGLEGEWTRGERGHTRWQTHDGLCPGLGGGCSFDVPIAVGATVRLGVDGIEGAEVEAAYTGGIEADGPIEVNESSDTIVPIAIVAAGPGRVELSDASGVVDAATVFGRVVTRLECGRWDRNLDMEWRMDGLVVTTEISIPVTTEAAFYLACRAVDESGPMLSADAISWTIVSGSESLDIRSTGFGTSGATAQGARIDAIGMAPGTAVVRASVGDVSQDLTITIE